MPSGKYDLIVVGAGSGGFAAALAAGRMGLRVLLVEKSESLGGNAARGGVNNWEPGVGGTGIPFDLYKRLKRIPSAIGIYSFGRHVAWQGPEIDPKYPGGEQLIDPNRRYLDSLRRFGAPPMAQAEKFRREHWHGIPYEPEIYAAEMEKMLSETGRVTVLKSTAFTDAITEGDLVREAVLDNGQSVQASFFVDSTADVLFAQKCGCPTSLGQEPRSLYQEPSAPEKPSALLNGATLIYRISPTLSPGIEPLSSDIPAHCWWSGQFPQAACTQYPNGDFNINSLPTMTGREAASLGYAAAYAECQRRIRSHWHHLQTVFPEFRSYRLSWVAPGLGVREGPRLVGQYVLTEHDLIAGLSGQRHDDIIAIADHAKDTHGADTGRAGTGEMIEPYGIPYRCLLTREYVNLAVACRGASLSSIAASSCRLSRTMFQFGQAAGTAVALALQAGIQLPQVQPGHLRQNLIDQGVELNWPRSPELITYLLAEDE